MVNKKCNMCKNQMTEKGTSKIGDTTYYMLVCEKCKHSVARSD